MTQRTGWQRIPMAVPTRRGYRVKHGFKRSIRPLRKASQPGEARRLRQQDDTLRGAQGGWA